MNLRGLAGTGAGRASPSVAPVLRQVAKQVQDALGLDPLLAIGSVATGPADDPDQPTQDGMGSRLV